MPRRLALLSTLALLVLLPFLAPISRADSGLPRASRVDSGLSHVARAADGLRHATSSGTSSVTGTDAALAHAARTGSGTTGAGRPSGHAVLVGMPGLRWSDVNPRDTPNLWRLAGRAGLGALSVRTVGATACPADGWATVSAGARAAGWPYCERPLPVTPSGSGAVVGDLNAFRRVNVGFGTLGLLGDAVHRAGGCTAAAGPGAALAAAGTDGRVDTYAATADAMPPGAWSRCLVTIVAAGQVGAATTAGGGRTATGAGGGHVAAAVSDRMAAARSADATVGSVLARVPADASVVVAGVSDDGPTPHLRVAMEAAPGTAGHYLGSDSTRRPDMTILPDLTATLLAAVHVPPPAGMIGTPFSPDATRPALDTAVRDLAGQDVAAQTHRRLLPAFFIAFVAGQLLLYGAAALALRTRRASRCRILAAARVTALAAAAVPAATYLVNLTPWWRAAHPAPWLVAGIAVVDVAVVALAVLGPWRRHLLGPGTVVAAIDALVLGVDLLTGSNLQMNSLMGYSPLVGGRYYGMGNIAFAVLATSALLTAAGVAQWLIPRRGRRVAVTAVLAITVTAAVLDSWTAWGSDFGGLIAFVPGLATTALLVAERRVSFIRLQLLRATGMFLVLGVAYLDHLRPPAQQTHMGRFWGQLTHGDALPWIIRKLHAMLHTFGNPTLLPVILAAVLFLTLVLHRPGRAGTGGLRLAYERAPMLKAGLSGAFVTALVGGAVNDSGIAVPALVLAVSVPLALAATLSALHEDHETPAPGSVPVPAGGG